MFKKKGSIGYLEGIRGTAAFGVFLNHFSLAFYSAYFTQKAATSHLNGFDLDFPHHLYSFINNGGFCVAIFFILSGYVLSRKYLITNDVEVLASGLHRRFLRLYIPIAFTLIVSYILMSNGLYQNDATSRITLSEWFIKQWRFGEIEKRFMASLSYGVMFCGDASFDTCLWTISYEFYGSLFVFAFLMFTHYTKNYRWLMMLLAAYFFIMMNGTTNSPFYIEFLLGMTLFYIEQRVAKAPAMMSNAAGIILVLVGLAMGSIPFCAPFADSWQDNIKTTVWDYTPWCLTIAAYLLVLGFVLSSVLQKAISTLPFRFLGYVSFSLYLIHPIMLGSFTSSIFLKVFGSSNDYNHSALIAFLATLALLLPVSWLMTKYVDQFGISLARKFYERVKNNVEVIVRKEPAATTVTTTVSKKKTKTN